MTKKICKICGEINSSNSVYCANCQTSLNDAKKKEDTQKFVNYGTIDSKYIGNPSVVRTFEWLIILIILAIPIVNIIMLIVIAFTWQNDNIKNFGRATLILSVAGFVLLLLLRSCTLL